MASLFSLLGSLVEFFFPFRILAASVLLKGTENEAVAGLEFCWVPLPQLGASGRMWDIGPKCNCVPLAAASDPGNVGFYS